MWKFNLQDRSETRVIDANDNGSETRLCGNDVCFADRSTGKLVRYDPSTKTKHTIRLDVGPMDLASMVLTDLGIDVSPDGRWLVYSRADSTQSDLMLVENFH